MSEFALEWRSVSFAVPHGFWMRPKTIIDGLDLAVAPGSAVGLVGPNGAGKTTTLKLGAGLIHPGSGRVLINGEPATKSQSRRRLGLLTETQYVYPHLRLKEWLTMAAALSGWKGLPRRKRVEEVLERMELTGQADQAMRTLSKGQTQRAGLAQAFVHEPDILLLDEPMSGLDPFWRFRIQQMLMQYKSSGGTLFFSSHILSDVERISDQVALISDGAIRWKGRLSDMPRRLTGYEVRCRAQNPSVLKKFARNSRVELQPDGACVLSVDPEQKEALLNACAAGHVAIESLRPIRPQIEEVLFEFNLLAKEKD
ncbi:MAG: ABC transporter ATP-binding protein [Desulfobacterales bacterium]